MAQARARHLAPTFVRMPANQRTGSHTSIAAIHREFDAGTNEASSDGVARFWIRARDL
jgi:hypothetical protein